MTQQRNECLIKYSQCHRWSPVHLKREKGCITGDLVNPTYIRLVLAPLTDYA